MQEEGDMSRHGFSVAYNGSKRLGNHSMDVDLLAPALLAFGKLIREANTEANGKKARANVFVVSDFEHKCFNINFDVVLTLLEQLRSLIATPQAKDAKEILEWLDILAGAGGTLGFLGFLKWMKGRKVESFTEIKDSEQSGMVVVRVEGDNNPVTIHQNTWNLAQNPRALAAAKDALAPLGNDGFDRLEIRNGDEIVATIPNDQAYDILASCTSGIEETKNLPPTREETPAWLTVYSPVYAKDADRWRFKLGKEIIYADISQTTIARDALERGGALADDTYQVRLEIETPRSFEGQEKKPTYKILSVLRFIPSNTAAQKSRIGDEPDERE